MNDRPVSDVRIATRGARFFKGDDAVMFEFQIDSRSKVGPRPAIESDKRQYPGAWQTFTDGEQPGPIKPLISAIDHPDAKAAHDAEAAKRQQRMDTKRGGL
jgi:hypothetical protein